MCCCYTICCFWVTACITHRYVTEATNTEEPPVLQAERDDQGFNSNAQNLQVCWLYVWVCVCGGGGGEGCVITNVICTGICVL